MQLKNPQGTPTLRAGLMAASCALLAPATHAQAPAEPEAGNNIDAGLLYYQEDQGRVRSIDAIVKLNRDFGDERALGVTLAVDSLSGGSPNGAIASNGIQTFVSPSARSPGAGGGRGEDDEGKPYQVAPGEQPLFPDFHDLRGALDVNWTQPMGIGNKLSVGGHLSYEYDFISASVNSAFSRDFFSKNTTVGLGVSAEFDQIKPVGGTPVPGSDYALLDKTSGNETKQVYGAQLGLTQVLTRSWITQLNLSVDRASGYLNDPYKILSRVDGTGGLLGYQFENRPGSHTRKSIYLGNKVAFGRSVLDISARYGTDDWGIHSRTLEARYRIPVGGNMYLEPQLRWYKQGAADFYRLYLTGADPVSANMSADTRLAAFTAKTLGLKLGIQMASGSELGIRLSGYEQTPKERTSTLPALGGLDLNPRLRAAMLQVDWRFAY